MAACSGRNMALWVPLVVVVPAHAGSKHLAMQQGFGGGLVREWMRVNAIVPFLSFADKT